MSKEKVKPQAQADFLSFEDVRVENRKSLKPRPEDNNLTKIRIASVSIQERDIPKFNEDGVESNWMYAGYTVPRLEIEVVQKPSEKDPHERYYTERFEIITDTKNDGTPVEPKKVINMYEDLYRRLQHYNNAIKTLPGYVAPNIKGLRTSGTAQEKLDSFKEFLQAYVDSFNSVDLSNKFFWFKVVTRYSDKGNAYYGTPAIVGEGFIELLVDKRAPGIELKPNETIVLEARKGKGKGSASGDSPDTPELASDIKSILDQY